MPENKGAPAAQATPSTPAPATLDGETDSSNTEEERDDTNTRIARQYLEDFVVTSLLRQGRPLKNSELTATAEGFTLSRSLLRDGLTQSQRVSLRERGWDLNTRLEAQARPREERTRQPLETTLEMLLKAFGKPLPLPVIARELALMRGVFPEAVREPAGQVLRTARLIIEVAPGAWLHQSFALDAGAPREDILIRENKLEAELDFQELRERTFPDAGGSLADRAIAVLQAAGRPLPQKVLGFFLWRQNPATFNGRELAIALGNRSLFYPLVGGYVAAQSQLPALRGALEDWRSQLGSAASSSLDITALLRQRVPAGAALAPSPEDLEELKKAARAGQGRPLSVVEALVDILEMEPDNENFVPALQGLNDTLRRSPEFLPAGIGNFLLRESVPSYVGELPEVLRPVHLSIRDTETDEPLDVEMSDDGLEGDAVEFIHAPQWEDVNEEVEVKLPRRTGTEEISSTRYTILNHHYRAGTIKLRRMDEDFFTIQGPLSRLAITANDGESTQTIGAWSSRESGLLYGLGEWFQSRVPQSGGVLELGRDASGSFTLNLGQPDKVTFIEDERIAELHQLQERSTYLALFDLLQTVMAEHQQGAELPTLWAEINAVRRTTKRLVCSVLSAYHCFYFRQRGPKQILWRFDEGKLDQGFKRNKRKYVRR